MPYATEVWVINNIEDTVKSSYGDGKWKECCGLIRGDSAIKERDQKKNGKTV